MFIENAALQRTDAKLRAYILSVS